MSDNHTKDIIITGTYNRYNIKKVNEVRITEPTKRVAISKQISAQSDDCALHYEMNTLNFIRGLYLNIDDFSQLHKGNMMSQAISFINTKLRSYKTQDEKKDRRCSMISLPNVIEKMLVCSMKCYYCKENVRLYYENVRDPTQWTLERIDNDIGHTNMNCEIACFRCNIQRRTSNCIAFKFTKQMQIKKV